MARGDAPDHTAAGPACRGRRRLAGSAFTLCLARRRIATAGREIHARLAGSCEHASRLFLFLDVMLDHFGEHRHLGVVVVIVGPATLDFGDRFLGAVVLDEDQVVQVLLLGGFDERGVEDLLLDSGMEAQDLADTAREVLFSLAVSSLLELREPLFDLSVVRIEERDRALACRRAPASPCSALRLCPGHVISSL